MFIVFLRVILIYVTVLIFLRLMGKRQIGEMQPYEVVITLIIADLATLPMSDTNIPLLNGLLPLAILVLVHYALTLFTRKSTKFRRFLSGKPIVVISPKGIEYNALKNLNMNINDVLEMMRQLGYYRLDQVSYVIVETNGKMSIIPNSANAPLTAQDMNINNPEPKLPHIIVFDGKINSDELQKSNLTKEKFNEILNRINVHTLKNLVLLSIDNDGNLYYQIKGESYQTLQNCFKEDEQ